MCNVPRTLYSVLIQGTRYEIPNQSLKTNYMKLKFITGLLLLTKITLAQVPATWTVNPADYNNQMYITAKLLEYANLFINLPTIFNLLTKLNIFL